MKFRRIFGRSWESGLRAVCYPDYRLKRKRSDAFSNLFNLWNDTQYLQEYLVKNQKALSDPRWEGITMDELIDLIMEEAREFELQIENFKTGEPGFERLDLSDIFRNIYKDVYVLHVDHFYQIREKPREREPLLRIYALQIKGYFIITGGLINLYGQPETELEYEEKLNLNRLYHFIHKEYIFSPEEINIQTIQ